MAYCHSGHSAACKGSEPPPGNRAAKIRPRATEARKRRFRGAQVPDPSPASANDGPKTSICCAQGRGAGLETESRLCQLDEISPNFLFCIPEGPTGGVASSF